MAVSGATFIEMVDEIGATGDSGCQEIVLVQSSTAVLAELERAFPKVPLNLEHAFAEWGRTYPDARAFRSFAHGRTWDALDMRYLETHDDVFGFLGTDALAKLLPAALAALIGGASPHGSLPHTVAIVLKRPTLGRERGLGHHRFDALLANLNAAQQRAVAATLRHFVEAHAEVGPAASIEEALESYWINLISG